MRRPSSLRLAVALAVALAIALAISVTAVVSVSAAPGRRVLRPLVHVKPHTRASLTFAGPWLRHPAPSDPHSQSVIELVGARGKRLRIRIYAAHAELMLYISRDALDTELIHRTELRVAPRKSKHGSRDPGASLGSGTVVKVIARRHGLAEVNVKVRTLQTAGTIQLRGYVPVSSIGTRCQPEVVNGSQLRARSRPGSSLPSSFALRGAPAGKPFAIGRGTGSLPVTVLARNAGHALVRFDAWGVVVTGWIDTAKLGTYRSSPDVYGGLVGGPGMPRPLALYDAPHGHRVGTLLEPSREKVIAHLRGWARYDLATRFGVARVWAAP